MTLMFITVPLFLSEEGGGGGVFSLSGVCG